MHRPPLALATLLSLTTGCSPDDDTGASGRAADTGGGEDTAAPSSLVFVGPDGEIDGIGEPEEVAAADVAVIGCGPAGMAAAIEASDAGASVVLVELDERCGGSGRYSGGMMTFSGTPEQEERGIEDSPEKLLAEWADMTGGDPADPWVVEFAERNVPDVRDWLVDLGASFGLGDHVEPGSSVPRVHVVQGLGEQLAEILAAALPDEAALLETEAVGLALDAESGEVAGVLVRGAAVPDGTDEGLVRAPAVVVATGGFLRNLDLVAQADPTLDTGQLWFSTGPHADGWGHELLGALGAAWDNAGAIGIYAHGVADPRTDGEELLFHPFDGTIWVDAEAARFVDETATNDFRTGRAVVERAGQLAWAVFDAAVREEASVSDPLVLPEEEEAGPSPNADDLEELGELVVADTLDDLAAALGLDADALAATVEEWNATVHAGGGDPFRDALEGAHVVEDAPFYGIRVVPVLAKAFGGIDVDLDGRVIDENGEVVLPGLFAAGELTGMAGGSLVGPWGFTGSLSAVVLSGRVAGGAAAAHALGR